jgi:nucleolar GTP-binding protein
MEKLDALEREEEKLEEEGFYDSEPQDFGSEDEREATELAISLQHKSRAQASKKMLRNKARLPRTAGLRTLSEMSQKMTEAGLDPSRIEERARVLARARAVKKSYLERGNDMDIDDDDDDAILDGMEVDGTQTAGSRKHSTVKPRTDRRLAGLRNAEVTIFQNDRHLNLRLINNFSSKFQRP